MYMGGGCGGGVLLVIKVRNTGKRKMMSSMSDMLAFDVPVTYSGRAVELATGHRGLKLRRGLACKQRLGVISTHMMAETLEMSGPNSVKSTLGKKKKV